MMMTKIILYLDAIVVYCFFEPILQFLQKITKKDNFWWAQVFISCANWTLIAFAVFLMINNVFFWTGCIIMVVGLIMIVGTSQYIWKFLMKKIHRPYRRSVLQKERDRGVYFAIQRNINPAMNNLRWARFRMWINIVIIMFLWLFLRKLSTNVEMFISTIGWYACAVTIWLYMRSTTPIANLECKKKERGNKYLTSIFLF
jgi:hypothetical protein